MQQSNARILYDFYGCGGGPCPPTFVSRDRYKILIYLYVVNPFLCILIQTPNSSRYFVMHIFTYHFRSIIPESSQKIIYVILNMIFKFNTSPLCQPFPYPFPPLNILIHFCICQDSKTEEQLTCSHWKYCRALDTAIPAFRLETQGLLLIFRHRRDRTRFPLSIHFPSTVMGGNIVNHFRYGHLSILELDMCFCIVAGFNIDLDRAFMVKRNSRPMVVKTPVRQLCCNDH